MSFTEIIISLFFQLTPLLLYLYNLLNPKGKPLKNMALNLMLAVSTPMIYDFEKEIMLLSVASVTLLCSFYFFSVRYFRHLCFILLYCLITFAIYYITVNVSHIDSQKLLEFMLIAPTLIILALILYWLLGLLLFGKSYLSWHDGVCLLWSTLFVLLDPTKNVVVKLLVYPLRLLDFDWRLLYVCLLFFSAIFTPCIFFYHLRYFIKLYRDKKFKQGSSKQ